MLQVAGHLKSEQDLSKESGSNRAIFEEKTEESAVRTIESKGFLQTSPLPLGYRAPALANNVPKPSWCVFAARASWKQRNLERETGFEPATSTLARSHSTTELLPLSPTIVKRGWGSRNWPVIT